MTFFGHVGMETDKYSKEIVLDRTARMQKEFQMETKLVKKKSICIWSEYFFFLFKASVNCTN